MLNKLLPKSEFSRNVFTLIKGTTLAQGIPILLSPVLTRLYTTDELGSLVYFVSAVAVLAVIATGRYELAIVLPKSDEKARNILFLSLFITAGFGIFSLFLYFGFEETIKSIVKYDLLNPYLYWIPILVLFLGAYQVLYYWYNRKKEYKLLSESRVLQNATTGLLNVIGGFLSFHLIGLIISRFIGQIASLAYFLIKKPISTESVRREEMAEVASQYNRFPKFLVFAHFLNSLSLQLPVFMITSFFGTTAVAFFGMTQRIVLTPLAIISNSIGDVFRQEASESFAETGSCKDIYVSTLKKLVSISLIPFIIFFFTARPLLTFIYGEDWSMTGDYAQILTLLYFMQFITRPLTNMFLIAQKQQLDVAWQVLLFISTAASFLIGYYHFNDVLISLTLFSIARSGCYLVALVLGFYLSTGRYNEQTR